MKYKVRGTAQTNWWVQLMINGLEIKKEGLTKKSFHDFNFLVVTRFDVEICVDKSI